MTDHHTVTLDHYQGIVDQLAAEDAALEMSTPEIIYLIPGEDIEGYPEMVWCESSAPSDHCDPDEAVKYVRADIHESALKRQGNAAKMGMDAAKKDASWREENARRLLAESNPAALESERAMNANLTGEVERLQARVAELESFINQAPVETGVCMCGEEMYRHGSQPNHTPMDSWDYERDLILRDEAEKAGGDR